MLVQEGDMGEPCLEGRVSFEKLWWMSQVQTAALQLGVTPNP